MNALNKMDMRCFDLFTRMSSITFRAGIFIEDACGLLWASQSASLQFQLNPNRRNIE